MIFANGTKDTVAETLVIVRSKQAVPSEAELRWFEQARYGLCRYNR